MLNIIIHGASGRMGRTIAAMALEHPDDFNVVAGIDKFPDGAGDVPFPVYASFDACAEDCDCIIDFSLAEALPGVIEAACAKQSALVVATTGLTDADHERMQAASAIVPIFNATNMSLGINLMIDLIKQAAAFFGDGFDIEILEKHHKIKVDAPSGTAMTLAKEVASVFPEGRDFVFDRHAVRQKRGQRELGISAVRGGTVVGEHDVMFLGEDEIFEITHKAYSKRVFGSGALRAAKFVAGLPPRLYSMSDIMAAEKAITNASLERDQCVVTLSSVPYEMSVTPDVFDAVAAAGVNVDMISQSMPQNGAVDIAFTLPEAQLSKAMQALSVFPFAIGQCDAMAKLCVEGAGMEHRPGVAAGVFRVLANAGIAIRLITTSETKIAVCLEQKDAQAALDAINAAFQL